MHMKIARVCSELLSVHSYSAPLDIESSIPNLKTTMCEPASGERMLSRSAAPPLGSSSQAPFSPTSNASKPCIHMSFSMGFTRQYNVKHRCGV